MTTPMSKERLHALANIESLERMTLPASHAESAEMARMLLAGMEQEPVAYAVSNDFWAGSHKKTHIDGRYCDLFHRDECNPEEYDHFYPLYAAPQPAPVAPDAVTAESCNLDELGADWNDAEYYAQGWNACRAAMLNEPRARVESANIQVKGINDES